VESDLASDVPASSQQGHHRQSLERFAMSNDRRQVELWLEQMESAVNRQSGNSEKTMSDAVAPVYAKHGLSIIQDLRTVERGIECYTTILHESGEERTYGPLLIVATKFDGQGVAAAGTYAKRIQLQAVANVVGDEDDDGESTVGRVNPSEDIKPQEFTILEARTDRRRTPSSRESVRRSLPRQRDGQGSQPARRRDD
jgi:hypothetical protein